MNNLLAQHQVAAIYQAMLGKKADIATLNYFGNKIASDKISLAGLANSFTLGQDGKNRYDGLNDNEKINYIYANITGTQPDAGTLAKLVAQIQHGTSLGVIAVELFHQVESYSGNDESALSQQAFQKNNIDTSLFPAFDKPAEFTSFAADIQAVYYVLGAARVSSGINYWADKLIKTPGDLDKIAQVFINDRQGISSLSNEDFVRKIFHNTFGTDATAQDIIHYTGGLQNNTETRGEVIVRMIADIRNDNLHPAARELFTGATHVYLAGEMPELKYQEVVAAFYKAIANSSVPASALDTYSKMLAAGTTEAQLLKILSASAQFSAATNYGAVYQYLYGTKLTASESQAILLKAGNNKYQATTLIVESFRNGEFPLDNHNYPLNKKLVINFESEINAALNYFTGPATLEVSANGGNPSGTLNTGKMHQLSNAELSQLTQITLTAGTEQSVDLSFTKITKITLNGEYSTSNVVLDSINKSAKDITLMLDGNSLQHAGPNVNLGNGNVEVIVSAAADIAHANTQLIFSPNANKSILQGLYWVGNGQNNGANQVSNTFTAKSSDPSATKSTLSANFITKDIYLTTQQDGSLSGVIKSSYDQFFGFQYIDLTHYKGTANIYLDGALVATEGAKVLDFGVVTQNATINNAQYADVGSLTQAAVSAGNYTGQNGLTISAYSGEIHVVNLTLAQYDYSPYSLAFNGDVTSDSKVYLSYTPNNATQAELQSFGIRLAAAGLQKLNAGTVDISAAGNYIGALIIVAEGQQTEKNLTLSGANNHIQRIELDGTNSNTLNLTISQDFSDSLKTISAIPYADHRAADIILNLNAEKGGTGGSGFFTTLSGLTNASPFSAITAQLAGDQLSVGNDGFSSASVTINHATVQGNTTLEAAAVLNFADSGVDNLVSLSKLATKTQINVGTGDQQWTFSATGNKTMQVYGSVSKPAEVNALFNSVDMTGVTTANALFGKLLSLVTHGASQGQLAEVGALKLDHSIYVIIDKNHNQSFDDQDIVFALGNQKSELDIYQTAVNLHYQSPVVSLTGSSQINTEIFA